MVGLSYILQGFIWERGKKKIGGQVLIKYVSHVLKMGGSNLGCFKKIKVLLSIVFFIEGVLRVHNHGFICHYLAICQK